jgi:hypothetical protein
VTQLKLKSGVVVYTDLKPEEIRQYLAGGSKGGAIKGYEASDGSIPIWIAVNGIEYIYI